MSIRVQSRVWDNSRHAGSELLMLLAIADFADDDGNAYPAVATLATKCRMSGRNVNHILASLRASGELEVRLNGGPRGVNRYRVIACAEPPKPASPLKDASPEAGFTPEEVFTLKPVSATPEAGFPKPLKPASDKPSLNRQEPSKGLRKAKTPKSAPPVIPDDLLPDWLRHDSDLLEAWHAFVAMRAEIKHPITVGGQEKALMKIGRWHTDGLDVCESLHNAVIGGHQGLFPPTGGRRQPSQNGRSSLLDADDVIQVAA